MNEPIYVPAWAVEHNSGFIGGFYIRPFGPMEKGNSHTGHAHHIDHMMFVEKGKVQVDWVNGDRSGTLIVESPNFVTVKAEAFHTVTALVNDTRWRCIFAEAECQKLIAEGANTPIPYMMEKENV